MANTLQAFNLLCDTVIEAFDENYNVSNRVNQVGDALEKFVKDFVKAWVKVANLDRFDVK